MTGMPYHAIAARNVFDGLSVLNDHAVIVDGCHIVDVVPRASVRAASSFGGLIVSLIFRKNSFQAGSVLSRAVKRCR